MNPTEIKTADADVLGEETHLQVSQEALETEENPAVQNGDGAVSGAAPASDPSAADPGTDENAAAFLKSV